MDIQHLSQAHGIRASLNEVVKTLMLQSEYKYKKFYLVFQETEEHKLVEKTIQLDLELFLRWEDMPVLNYKITHVADTVTIYIYMVNWF